MTQVYYPCVMNTIKNGSASALGVEPELSENQVMDAMKTAPTPTVAELAKWTKQDLNSAIRLLDAIRKDEELVNMLAQWFQGRIENYKNLPKQ